MAAAEPGREFRGGLIVGPERNEPPIEVVPYDPAWPARYTEMRARLAESLGPLGLRIDHVGSTAVPGLAAKPIVDIQVSVADVEDTAAYRAPIERHGIALRYIEPGHRYFRPRPGVPRLWQVHVCQIGSDWERVHLLFRDYLRANPAAAVEYAALKERMALQHPLDRIAYTDAKGPWIEVALRQAEAWASSTGWRP